MIPADLLTRLQEADPALWIRYVEGRNLIEDEDFDSQIGDLIDAVKESWLQHCLQAAIRARKWSYRIIWAFSVDICKAFICTGPGVYESVNSDTEAEALLRAYLAAIQA